MFNFFNLMISTAKATSSYLPIEASTIASDVDGVYNFVMWVSIFFFFVLMGGMCFFIYKYRRRTDNDKTAYITHNYALEFLWSFIPLVLLLVAFFWGWKVYMKARILPENAEVLNVVGKQWMWNITYSNGKQVTNEFYVPVNKPVVLSMTSEDVIHSFYVPSFRIKQDVVPGKRTQVWFESNQMGTYRLFCTEFCGTAHSTMIGKVHVVSHADYQEWLAKKSGEGLSPAELGKELLTSKGCVACHSEDGSPRVGPTFKGVWGKQETFTDGSTVTVNEDYVRESVLNPQAKVVKGYPPTMPSFQGQLKEEEINGIIEYFKTLK